MCSQELVAATNAVFERDSSWQSFGLEVHGLSILLLDPCLY